MNIENMKKLRDSLEDSPVAFNMSTFFRHNDQTWGLQFGDRPSMTKEDALDIVDNHPCGTAACLAGHAAILAWQEGEEETNLITVAEKSHT